MCCFIKNNSEKTKIKYVYKNTPFLKYITKQSSKTRSRTKRKSSFQNNFFYFGKTPEKTLVF